MGFRVSLNLRLKDLLGPVTRVKKKKFIVQVLGAWVYLACVGALF